MCESAQSSLAIHYKNTRGANREAVLYQADSALVEFRLKLNLNSRSCDRELNNMAIHHSACTRQCCMYICTLCSAPGIFSSVAKFFIRCVPLLTMAAAELPDWLAMLKRGCLPVMTTRTEYAFCKPLDVVAVPPDGNCLFSAIACSMALAERRAPRAAASRVIRDFLAQVLDDGDAVATMQEEHALLLQDAYYSNRHPQHTEVMQVVSLHQASAAEVRS